MTRLEFIRKIGAIYATANKADCARREPWQDPSHAATICGHLDEILRNILSAAELQSFHDNLGEFGLYEGFALD